MRAELIPAIVILLQKQWRGAICRAKFRKMKAAYFIIKFYRRYKIRTYVKSVLEAHRLTMLFMFTVYINIPYNQVLNVSV